MNKEKVKTVAVKDKRRYKYGSLSAVFTVVFVALIIVINLIFSSLSLSGNLTVDLTQEEFTTISAESIERLSQLGEDLNIEIIFMSPRDQFDLSANNYNGINLTAICRDLAENYTKIFDGKDGKGTITVTYKELDKDPEFEKQYLEESGTTLTSTSVIIKGKYHYRILNVSAFFTKNEEGGYSSFKGEYLYTAAMIQSSIPEKQVATLMYGHGEPINADGTISADSRIAGLRNILDAAGFEVVTTDISREEINERTEILICYDPVTDLSFDEVETINKYLAKRNAFIAFVDSATPELSALQSLLNDHWGIGYKPNYCITDNDNSFKKETIIKAKYPEISSDIQNTSAAYQIHKNVTDAKNKDSGHINTVFPESVELEIMPTNTQQGFIVETIFTTYDTADSKNGETLVSENKEMPLALVSSTQGFGENNVSEFSYCMLVGSTDFANTGYLSAGNYGNKLVLLGAARIFSSNYVAPDIDYKEFQSTALEIENGTARTLTWVICTVLPGIILIMGLVVFFRRRHL